MSDNSFSDAVLSDWENAMDRFFDKVEDLMRKRELTPEQVRKELDRGYGYDIGDSWAEWIAEDS